MTDGCGRYVIKRSEINTSKWFNIKEKEPSIKGGTYLIGIIDNYGDTVVFIELIAAYIVSNVFNVEGKGEVYADYWMPLPEPPEELKS